MNNTERRAFTVADLIAMHEKLKAAEPVRIDPPDGWPSWGTFYWMFKRKLESLTEEQKAEYIHQVKGVIAYLNEQRKLERESLRPNFMIIDDLDDTSEMTAKQQRWLAESMFTKTQ